MSKIILILGILIISIFIAGCQVVSEDEEAAVAEIIAEEEGITEEEAANMAGTAIETGRMKWLSCQDSDNGQDYSVKGEATVRYMYKGKEKTVTRTDRCTHGGYVKEYYCKETLRLAIDGHLCEAGCEDTDRYIPADGCGNTGACEDGACITSGQENNTPGTAPDQNHTPGTPQ